MEETRKIPGYHDEPLKGNLFGKRSVKLSKGYRVYYSVIKEGNKYILILDINKHEYNKVTN